MSKKKLAGIIVACIIGIFVVLAIAIPSEPTSTPSTTPPSTTKPTPTPAPTSKEIVMGYSVTITNERDSWIGPSPSLHAETGYTFVLVNLDIENDGYESFETGQFLFCIVVNKVRYIADFYYPEEEALKSVDLLDGGKISGKIVFEVPEEVLTAGYQLGYRLKTAAGESYNIKWVKQ